MAEYYQNAPIVNQAPPVPTATPINMNISYPYSDEYEYMTQLVRYNLDEERIHDILSDNGHIVSPTRGVKKDMKDPNSIFSSKFGQTLKDVTQFGNNRYKCQCGYLTNKINENCICPVCGTKVKDVGDNFEYTAWIVLKDKYYIHMAYFESIKFFIGKDFDKIINPKRVVDEDGNEHEADKPANQPFYGIGMMKFKDKFDEIMNFYLKKSPHKQPYYDDIMSHRSDIFAQSIPVFTTLLRPFSINQQTFSHEDTNATYNMINKLVSEINSQSKYKIQRRQTVPKDKLLYDLQMKVKELYDKVIKILSGKRGAIRTLFGGRCNFSGRSVIVANPDLRIDEVTLPYTSLLVLLQQLIINVLNKSYGMSYNDAYRYWHQSYIQKNDTMVNIINNIIKESDSNGRGLPVIINRNPTIQYGSILQMFCIGMTDTYTMAVPLQILPLLAAD